MPSSEQCGIHIARYLKAALTTLLFGALWYPCPALAVQTHGPPEGLYAHQIAHMGFLVAMVYIWLRTRHRDGEGWRLIRISFVFFAIWNINTVITHGIAAGLDPNRFEGHMGPLPRYFVVHSAADLYFFFGKMDHLLCIPAALCLGMGLRRMRNAISQTTTDDVH